MMRYSLKDFLKYQNELNNKCDEEKVERIIDSILKDLKRCIETHPTQHKCTLNYYAGINSDSDRIDYIRLSHCSATELSQVKDYFEQMGFKVSYSPEDYITPELKHWYIAGFTFEW